MQPAYINREIHQDAAFFFRMITSGEMTEKEAEAEIRISPQQKVILARKFFFDSSQYRAALWTRERVWRQLQKLLEDHREKNPTVIAAENEAPADPAPVVANEPVKNKYAHGKQGPRLPGSVPKSPVLATAQKP
jgi:hypothetical protein